MELFAKYREVWSDISRAYKIIEEHRKVKKQDVYLDYIRYDCGRGVEFKFQYKRPNDNTLACCVKKKHGLKRSILNKELFDYYEKDFRNREFDDTMYGIC